jgi:hypothetical protein
MASLLLGASGYLASQYTLYRAEEFSKQPGGDKDDQKMIGLSSKVFQSFLAGATFIAASSLAGPIPVAIAISGVAFSVFPLFVAFSKNFCSSESLFGKIIHVLSFSHSFVVKGVNLMGASAVGYVVGGMPGAYFGGFAFGFITAPIFASIIFSVLAQRAYRAGFQ